MLEGAREAAQAGLASLAGPSPRGTRADGRRKSCRTPPTLPAGGQRSPVRCTACATSRAACCPRGWLRPAPALALATTPWPTRLRYACAAAMRERSACALAEGERRLVERRELLAEAARAPCACTVRLAAGAAGASPSPGRQNVGGEPSPGADVAASVWNVPTMVRSGGMLNSVQYSVPGGYLSTTPCSRRTSGHSLHCSLHW